ncbi:transcription termination factor Rho [Stackebrandtia endophytica]|uniref:Transcription termination factor Rho n=2 Tax=Stackebrandtia endophytica TaxID=1496996 RepID=A0A543B0B5_9ACTN|nr:transcription termination factor Rho [Stackebrandtia endophytica]TQL78264.1 transcription termination factor Rho [Stackebrandtia endophytica]
MLMPELQQLANSLGISSIGRMRKSELITAIQAQQGKNAAQPTLPEPESTPTESAAATSAESDSSPAAKARRATRAAGPPQPRRSAVVAADSDSGAAGSTTVAVTESTERGDSERSEPRTERRRERTRRTDSDATKSDRGGERQSSGDQSATRSRTRDNAKDASDEDGRRRNRRHRDRDRRGNSRSRERSGGGGEPQVNEDDVLVPVAGIVDILDNYAFLRTTGYLAGPTDVYVSMSQVRKHGLRRGDAVTGMVKAPKEEEGNGNSGKRREKYNPLIRLDTVNGTEPDQARKRPDFYKLTPLYPQQRLRLETESHLLTTRVIDLVAPIGKGQRALIVSPPKAGKTMVMQSIANAITTNNPECHLMVVLVDERPEEVTDMQRSVKGEVISSTFDRHPSDHTTVAELSIERAKRLVELGHDVVVLLDGITRLGRAYNNATPASGRIMSGGIDATALYPPKRFLGAARNIENGGSLTIIATALVETGSMGDTVIFEEFKGTGNSELKLDRKLADKRTYPAVDVHQSSTRRDDLMMGPDEAAIMLKLRRVLGSLDPQQAIELLLDQLKKNKTNSEFLMQIAKTTPGND